MIMGDLYDKVRHAVFIAILPTVDCRLYKFHYLFLDLRDDCTFHWKTK